MLPEQLEAMDVNVQTLANQVESTMQENQHLSSTLRDITITPLTQDAKELASKLTQEVPHKQYASQMLITSYYLLERDLQRTPGKDKTRPDFASP